MLLASLGHESLLVTSGGCGVLVDPLSPLHGGFGPEARCPDAVLDDVPCDAVVLTSADVCRLHVPTLERLGRGRQIWLAGAIDPRRVREPAASGAIVDGRVKVSGGLWADRASASRSRDCGVLVGSDACLLWIPGPDRPLGQDVTRARLLGCTRRYVIASACLDHPRRVARGGARGFPADAHAARVRNTAELASALDAAVLVVGGLGFHDAASWLNPLAQPLSRRQLCEDLGAFCPGLAAVPLDPGRCFAAEEFAFDGRELPTLSEARPSGFDPSRGIPPLTARGMLADDPDVVLAAACNRLASDPTMAAHLGSAAEWDLTIEIAIAAVASPDRWTLDLGVAGPRARAGGSAIANVRAAITAAGFTALTRGNESVDELLLGGDLRIAERVHRVHAGCVRRPTFFDPTAGLVGPGADRVFPLLSPSAWLGLLSPLASPPRWPG